MTWWSTVGTWFAPISVRAARRGRTGYTVCPVDNPRIAARGLPIGLEDRNDRKFGDAGSL
jgi:hypothetical protein